MRAPDRYATAGRRCRHAASWRALCAGGATLGERHCRHLAVAEHLVNSRGRYKGSDKTGLFRAVTYIPLVMETLACPATKGSPREFCLAEALAAALRVFWSKGYDGASMTEQTEAMDITKPSLYAAFGNKESLFRKALDLYEREKLYYIGHALEQPTARGGAKALLEGAFENQCSASGPRGC